MNKIIIIISCLFTAVFSQAQISYTPQTASGYQFKYLKADSGFAVTYRDTTIGRGTTRPGSIVCRPQDSLFYGYNGLKWVKLGNDAIGAIEKVDSVTITAGVLYYWINGASTGVTLPVGFTTDLQGVTDLGNTTTNNIEAENIRANNGLISWQKTNLDYVLETKSEGATLGTYFRSQLKADSLSHDSLKWYLPDTSGVFVTSVNGVLPNKKGQINIPSLGSGSFDTTTIYNNLALKLNITDTAAILANYVNDADNGLQKLSSKVIGLGGTLNQHTAIDGDGGLRRLNIQNVQYFRAATPTGGDLGVTASGIDMSGGFVDIANDSVLITNATTSTTTNNLAGFQANGKITRVNLGSGLGIISGVLTNTAPLGTDSSVVADFGLTKNVSSNAINLKVDTSVIATPHDLTAKQNTLTLTTTGTSGAATLISDVLNIPQYSGGSGLTYTNTPNKYLNDYGNFSTLNADSITAGSTNQFSKWATSGSDINNTNAGNVGIGTASPATKLEVNGTTTTTELTIGADPQGVDLAGSKNGFNAYFNTTSSTAPVSLLLATSNAGSKNVRFQAYPASYSSVGIEQADNGALFTVNMPLNIGTYTGQDLKFWASNTQKMTLASNGDLSIANLTTNGYVKTSGGTGLLSVSTAIPQADVTNLTTDLGNRLQSSNFVYNEEFTGSTSSTYTLANTPITGKLVVFKNGLKLPNSEFSLSGTTVTLTSARLITDIFSNDYIK